MHLFDFTKRFKDSSDDTPKLPSPKTIKKRQKSSLTLSDFSKRFNYRSMRNKARKMCSINNSPVIRSRATSRETPEITVDLDGDSDKKT